MKSSIASEQLHIILVEPLIPQNTGTIARLTAATYTKLHLIEPLGFELSDKYLKRAGLDYWPEVDLSVYKTWDEFLANSGLDPKRFWFLSKFGSTGFQSVEYALGDGLVFGNESKGLDPHFHESYAEQRIRIPMENPNVRSLNLSNAVSIVLYEARRQLGIGLD